jgi:hypothetical protein
MGAGSSGAMSTASTASSFDPTGTSQMISGGLGAGMGIYRMISAAKEQRDARRAMEDYERQKLTNVADGMQVSTLGSDLQREEQARLASSQNQMLADSGTRGIVGGLGKVTANNQKVMQQTGADLDQQQKQIEMMQAEDNARIRTMQEARENADLSALSSQYQSGKMDMNLGAGNLIQGLGQASQGYGLMNRAPGANGMQYGSVYGSNVNGANTGFQSSAADRFNTNYNTADSNFVNGTGYQNLTVPNAPQYGISQVQNQNPYGLLNNPNLFKNI